MGTKISKLAIGDRVRVRDRKDQNWGNGVLTEIDPPRVTLINFQEALEFKFIEKLSAAELEDALFEAVPDDIWVIILRFSHYHHQLKVLESEKYAHNFVLRRVFKHSEQLWLPETIIFHKPKSAPRLPSSPDSEDDSSSGSDSWGDGNYRSRIRAVVRRQKRGFVPPPKSWQIGQTVYFVGTSVYFGNGIEEGAVGVLKAVTTDHENDQDKMVVSFRASEDYDWDEIVSRHGRAQKTKDYTLSPSDISDKQPRRLPPRRGGCK